MQEYEDDSSSRFKMVIDFDSRPNPKVFGKQQDDPIKRP